MTDRLTVTRVPEVQAPRGIRGREVEAWKLLEDARRIVDTNFQNLRNAIQRAALSGGLIGDDTITLDMLTDEAKQLVGEVTGSIGNTGSTTVAHLTTESALLAAGSFGRQAVFIPEVRAGTGITLVRDAGGVTLSTAGVAPDDAQAILASSIFGRVPSPQLDVRPGSGIAVTRDAQGFIVASTAVTYPGPEDASLQIAAQVFAPRPVHLDVRPGSGVTVTRDAQGFVVAATASSYPGADDASLQIASQSFARRARELDVRAGSGVTVTRDAGGFIVAATSGSAVDDQNNILANQVFGP